ncbi:MAG: D-hexose-6-phosphate mutarotase, partial [Pseudomonas sp.]|nr:D-hexose-6-phosphate mutarotase [Pseudomonas sp.]
GWQGMLCIETANVLDDVVNLAPGESHTLGVSITALAL